VWQVFTFHDIGDGRLGTATAHFTRLVEHLDRRRADIWVAPIADVAQWVVKQRAAASG
jgi:hypothetical protein